MGLISNITRFFGGFSGISAENAPTSQDSELRSGLATPSDWFLDWLHNGRKSAGQNVTPETSMRISAVYASVSLLVRTIASLQVGLYRKSGTIIEEVTDLPEAYAVTFEPHTFYDSYQWRAAAMLHLMLRGNHYSKLSFDRNGRVNEIRILHPDNVIPYIYEDKLYYRVTIDEQGRSYVLLPNEIIHLKLFGEDGIIGKSPLSYARETVGMALAANDYAAAMYENGGGVRGVIERAPMNMTGPQMDQLRNEFVKIMRDYRTSGSIGVLRGETKFTQIALSPKDAQFIESANLSTKDIARFFGVPLHLIGDLERSTNNNIEHQSIEFVMHTVRPLVKNWESELNRKVLRKSDRSSMFFRFNIDSLMRGDTAARAQYYQTMTNIGAMSLDEVRNMENLNPIADGYGQQHYMQLNMTTLQGINEKSNLTNANTGQ